MSFTLPTADQAIYRLNRLQRVIAIALVGPAFLLLGTAWLAPDMNSLALATYGLIGIALIVMAHVAVFPNAALETVSLAMALSGLVTTLPIMLTVAGWAPVQQQLLALMVLSMIAGLAVAVLGALLHIMLDIVVYAGPAVKWRIQSQLDLPCGVDVARRQLALQPAQRRGRVLTGPADDNGFFDVAVALHNAADPVDPDRPMVVRVAAKVLGQTDNSHSAMIVMPSGSVTVTSQHYAATKDGCRVQVRDLPCEFTVGMHVLSWLTDQQADILTEMADVITGQDPRANSLSHGETLLTLTGAVLSPRAISYKKAR